jgi:hypothetical protein
MVITPLSHSLTGVEVIEVDGGAAMVASVLVLVDSYVKNAKRICGLCFS